MSFGQYEYQHRFYRQQPHVKAVAMSGNDSNVIPGWGNTRSPVYYTPQVQRHHEYGNHLNLKVRAGEIAYNEPGWQAYRLKSYVTDKYSQNYQSYQSDRDMIQRFKREAEQQKRKRRFAGREYQQEVRNQQPLQHLPHIRMRTQQAQQPRQYSPLAYELPKIAENPEIHEDPNRYDVGVMARLEMQSRQKYYESRYKSMKAEAEKKKIREYKKKYSKLKNKLKEELRMQHESNSESNHKKEEYEDQNMSRIQNLITDVSDRLAKNAIIFNEGLRVDRQLREMRQRSPSPIPVSLEPQQIAHKQTYYTQPSDPIEPKQPSPRIIYNPKPLDKSYLQLQRLKQEITCINRKIDHNYRLL